MVADMKFLGAESLVFEARGFGNIARNAKTEREDQRPRRPRWYLTRSTTVDVCASFWI